VVLERSIGSMDYYPILKRSIASLGVDAAQTRAAVFLRTRELTLEQLRRSPGRWSEAAIEQELKSFDAATVRIESELASIRMKGPGDRSSRRRGKAEKEGGAFMLTVSLMLLAGLISHIYINNRPGGLQGLSLMYAQERAAHRSRHSTTGAQELVLQVEDVSSAADDRGRQLVSYRSLYPEGTIIIDRWQRLLYLVQPQSRAWRYAIAVGDGCPVGPGFQRIAEKAEWSASSGPSEAAYGGDADPIPDGAGNPDRARALYFEDGIVGITPVNAPEAMGEKLSPGCFRLMDEDAVDLDQRVSVGAAVVVLN
jgi:lipoprotein-anchoring transpeptidase ErfK/SrfK